MRKFKKIWIPRLLTLIIILFLSIFALDVFDGKDSLIKIIEALFIHMIPSIILLFLLILSWRYQKLSGILFILLCFIFTVFFHTYTNIINFSIISLPILIVGVMFISIKN